MGGDNINLLDIEAFLIIVETQSLSRASEKLFLTQSTLTHRLNVLEKELGIKLINRSQGKRYITLTAKGDEFLLIANQWISLKKDTDIWKTQESKLTLNIGLVDSLGSYVFPPLFRKVTEIETPLSLKISSHWSVTICKLLESNEVDIGIVSRLIKSNTILSEPIFSEQMVLVSSSTTSCYGDVVHPNELEKKSELLLDWGEDFRLWHDFWWNPKESINLTLDTSGLILNCLNIPYSWAIVPIAVAHYFKSIKPIKISKLTDPPPERICYKIKNRYTKHSRIEALKIFEQLLNEFIINNSYLKKIY